MPFMPFTDSKTTAPYGTWPSEVTLDVVVGEDGGNIEEVFVDPVTTTVYHIETRSDGRSVIVHTTQGSDVFGAGWSARTGVEEYGGAAAIAYNGVIYFSNFSDSRVYSIMAQGAEPQAITPVNTAHRFAKFAVHPVQNHLLVAVFEDHTKSLPADVVTTLCLINSLSKTVTILVSGTDFYSSPCFSPDGSQFAWQQWSHPDMPWQGGEVHVAQAAVTETSITLSNSKCVAGKKSEIGAAYPIWASNDVLGFTSDAIGGFQNPWKYSVSAAAASSVSQPEQLDFSQPAWNLSYEFWAPLDLEGNLAAFSVVEDGKSALYVVYLNSGKQVKMKNLDFTDIDVMKRVTDNRIVFVGSKAKEAKSIVRVTFMGFLPDSDVQSACSATILSKSPLKSDGALAPYISVGDSISLTTPDNKPLYAVYYPPTNPNYEGPKDEKAPCIFGIHGGPTGLASQGLDWTKQYFTSRGWAWVDVNYRGSSGYGRDYIDQLAGEWGVVDVADCARVKQLLSSEPYNLVDPKRCAIRGGSAGGFTTLATSCFRPDAFGAGTSMYGISDLQLLAETTHKFESHYVTGLVGGTPEEIPEVYRARSPLYHADKITSPLLVLQGAIDAVVPRAQADEIVKSIRYHGGTVEYRVFEGEGHGWRMAATVKTALDLERAFYEKYFKVKPTP